MTIELSYTEPLYNNPLPGLSNILKKHFWQVLP